MDPTAALEDLFRREYGRIVAMVLARISPSGAGSLTGHSRTHSSPSSLCGPGADLMLAEDAVNDALSAAVRSWPVAGIPHDPAGWLYQVAWHRALDRLRRRARHRKMSDQLAPVSAASPAPDEAPTLDDELALVLLCCDPVLSGASRAALALKVVGGLATSMLAAAFLVTEATMAQRLVRAKRRLRSAYMRPSALSGDDLAARRGAALDSIYLMFNAGYSRPGEPAAVLVNEALRMGSLMMRHPKLDSPETRALLALMCLQSARLSSRLDSDGALVRLADQDRSLWDQSLIAEGLRHLSASAEGERASSFHLMAGIAAAHATSASVSETPWEIIVQLYDDLEAIASTAVVRLNATMARFCLEEAAGASGRRGGPVGVARGGEAGGVAALSSKSGSATAPGDSRGACAAARRALAQLDAIAVDAGSRLEGYSLWLAARAEMLERVGRHRDAHAEWSRAVGHAASKAEEASYRRRLEAADHDSQTGDSAATI